MSPQQALIVAEQLFNRGKLDSASEILTELAAAEDETLDRTQIQFLTAMIAGARGEFSIAEEAFRKILDDKPDLVRVRLELARVLFAQRKDQSAAYHFRLALAAGLPPEAQENIRTFLSAIEQRKIWRVGASIGIAPDSNISAGPKDETVNLFGLPFELDADARERSGLGLATSLNAQIFPKIKGPFRLELRGGGSVTDYSGIEFDDVFLFAEAGPRYQGRSFSISALGAFSRRFFGGESFSRSVGGKIAVQKGLTSRTNVGLRVSGASVRYDLDASRDGEVYAAGLQLNHVLTNVSSVFASVNITREQSASPFLQNTQYALIAGYRRELPFGVTAQIGPDVYYRRFDECAQIDFGTDCDLTLAPVREDWTYGGSIFVTKRDWRLYGFAPVFSYQYLRNDSNSERAEFTRHRANIGLTRTF